ncbi:MAG: hypothetical protein A3B38_03470 [Candidatus Levybacteria bacterium RIFCSPLOWO2_01_FULL_36_13]|nr:MAG: hypothetical protein A2684_00405 [Candidatus Levybacteria bacterium RIFCSPHIGHO2_01_FULL_36_15b]OGH34199.1 MAG: hypothetical protein A3B38_03470 [Candidatus Levybacteria bacterium RIFCSPLOWO2_01_FULL_36_13]
MNKEYDPRKIERERDLSIAGQNLKERITKANGIFSETVVLKSIQRTNFLPTETNRIVKSFFYRLILEHNRDGGDLIEGLFKTAFLVNKRFPELIFTFEQDEERKSIKYFVQDKEYLSRL